jgi:hypothetical protein
VRQRRLGAIRKLVLELGELPLGNPECLIDRVMQIGPLKFPLQVVRLMSNHDILVAGQPYLDTDHRRNRLMRVVGALIDPNPAGGQPLVDVFEPGNVVSDFVFSPV